MTESHFGQAKRLNKLIPEKEKRTHKIMQSVDVNDPFINYTYNEEGQKTENKAQTIQYEEDKQEIENIDDELKIMDGIQELNSEEDSPNKSNTSPNNMADLLIKKSIQASSQVPNKNQSITEIKAQELVDQIKELLIIQISQSLNDDSQVHYGIK